MGRLRADYERPLFLNTTEEVVDLFGVDDVVLFRFSSADNVTGRDPLYCEPSTTVQYTPFKIKAMFLSYDTTADASEEGLEFEKGSSIYIALNHLLKAMIPIDPKGDYVTEGDAIGLHYKGDYTEFDIILVNRDGFINDSDKFTGYRLDVKRRDKYISERKTGGIP